MGGSLAWDGAIFWQVEHFDLVFSMSDQNTGQYTDWSALKHMPSTAWWAGLSWYDLAASVADLCNPHSLQWSAHLGSSAMSVVGDFKQWGWLVLRNHWEGWIKVIGIDLCFDPVVFYSFPLTRRSWKYSGHASLVTILSSCLFGNSLLEQLDFGARRHDGNPIYHPVCQVLVLPIPRQFVLDSMHLASWSKLWRWILYW